MCGEDRHHFGLRNRKIAATDKLRRKRRTHRTQLPVEKLLKDRIETVVRNIVRHSRTNGFTPQQNLRSQLLFSRDPMARIKLLQRSEGETSNRAGVPPCAKHREKDG